MNRLFDFHTHILPGIDDGSRSVEESIAMLKELARQGASGIAATPHFYAQRSSPEHFFKERQTAWNLLKSRLRVDSLEIRLGAEVQYFEGIQRLEGLEQFCLEGTRLLLVEMPMCTWTRRMISAIIEVNSRENVIVLLAHIERYWQYWNEKALEQFREHGVLMQASTSLFVERRHKAIKLLREGKIHLLGTDSHNMDNRKPDMKQALENINRKNGEQLLLGLIQREAVVLNEMEIYMDCL
ncbi:MAG: histidinol-phosphatase [Clostridia bacterium]|nr:histidinol-phosphatase [Clostridia bacterium]